MYKQMAKVSIIVYLILLIPTLIFYPYDEPQFVSNNSAGVQETVQRVMINGPKYYVAPTGKKYHHRKNCGGKRAYEIDKILAQKNYAPCKKCAK